ncbi:MAG: TetR/AcrR family transcriptional regulator [Candidatus Sericytochromatia bacterium]
MLASYTGTHTKVPLFRKNPESSRLGTKLIDVALEYLVEQGLERLTFRKLAEQMQSTEASIYRYFTNKYQLLSYLAYRGLSGIFNYLSEKLPKTPVEQQLHLLLSLLDPSPKLYADSSFRRIIPLFMVWKTHEQEAETQAEIQVALEPLQKLRFLISDMLVNVGIPAHKTPLLESLLLFQNMGFSSIFLECMQLKKQEIPLFWEELLVQQSKMRMPMTTAIEIARIVTDEVAEDPLEADEEPAISALTPEIATSSATTLKTAKPTPTALESTKPFLDKPTPAFSPLLLEEISFEALDRLGIAHIMQRKAGGYNLLEVKEFFSSYDLEQRKDMLKKGKVSFISYEGIPLELSEVLRVLGVDPAQQSP